MTYRVAAPGILAVAIGSLAAGGAAPTGGPGATRDDAAPFRFVDVAREAGLTTPVWAGREDKPHLLESGGCGVALFDYDRDGDLDLYLVNGWRLEGTEVVERGRNVLYRNRGDGTFEDVTEQAGVGDDSWGAGVAVGDIENDGDLDLFVTNFGPDLLYRNEGDGTFALVANAPSIDNWTSVALLFDADRDGDKDLFVAGYVDATLDEVIHAERELVWNGVRVMRGPFGLEGLANRYWVNDGAGLFSEATSAAGLDDVGLFYSFAAAAADLDGDDALDLYVANDSNPNYLYRNDGKGVFREVGLFSGAGLDQEGMAQAGMGLALGDVDGDEDLDVFVTNFSQDTSTLYRNEGGMYFVDATGNFGLREITYMPLSWGAQLADLDLDGDIDLFIANGHIYPQADVAPGIRTSYRQRNLVIENTGAGFVDVSAASGPGLEVVESSRGVAIGDIDGDGDLDLAISNIDAPPTLLRNDTRRRGSWLMVDAPDALRVTVEAGGRRFVRHRVIGATYVSVNDPRFHFGLGPVDRVERMIVRWPDGNETVLTDVGVDRVIAVSG